MTDSPRLPLSIVVPMRNEAHTIGACLAQLQQARAHGAEVLVVDGASSDASVVHAQDGCDRVICAEPGRATQLQAGAAAARGDVIWFVHADVRVPVDGWREIAAARAAGAAWGRFDVQLDDHGADARGLLLKLVAAMMNLRSRLTRICTGDQAMFVTRVALDAIAGVPRQPLMEDIEMSVRLKRVGPMAALRRPVLVSARRWRARGVLRTVLLMWSLRLAYLLGVSPTVLHRWYYG